MAGYIKDENSLANGIPNRNIGPETGSSGNATETNKSSTGEGVNIGGQDRPAAAAAFDSPKVTTDDLGERRSFTAGTTDPEGRIFPDNGDESIAQQIADGGDRSRHDKDEDEDRAR